MRCRQLWSGLRPSCQPRGAASALMGEPEPESKTEMKTKPEPEPEPQSEQQLQLEPEPEPKQGAPTQPAPKQPKQPKPKRAAARRRPGRTQRLEFHARHRRHDPFDKAGCAGYALLLWLFWLATREQEEERLFGKAVQRIVAAEQFGAVGSAAEYYEWLGCVPPPSLCKFLTSSFASFTHSDLKTFTATSSPLIDRPGYTRLNLPEPSACSKSIK